MEASCLQGIDIIEGRKSTILRMQAKISSFYEPFSTPKSPPDFEDNGEANNELTPYPKETFFFFTTVMK